MCVDAVLSFLSCGELSKLELVSVGVLAGQTTVLQQNPPHLLRNCNASGLLGHIHS